MKILWGVLIVLLIGNIAVAASCTVDSSGVTAVFSDTNLPTMDAFKYLTRDSSGDVYQKQTLTASVLGTPSCAVNGNSCTVDMSSVSAVIMPDNQVTTTVYDYVKDNDQTLYASISGTPTCTVGSDGSCTVDSSTVTAQIVPFNQAAIDVPRNTYVDGNILYDGSVISRTLTAGVSGTPTCTVSGNTCTVDSSSLTGIIQPSNQPTETLHFGHVTSRNVAVKLQGQATCSVGSAIVNQQDQTSAPLTIECTIDNHPSCVDGNIRTCKLPDGKWQTTFCPPSAPCKLVNLIPTCSVGCTLNQIKCIDNTHYQQCLQDTASGALYWSGSSALIEQERLDSQYVNQRVCNDNAFTWQKVLAPTLTTTNAASQTQPPTPGSQGLVAVPTTSAPTNGDLLPMIVIVIFVVILIIVLWKVFEGMTRKKSPQLLCENCGSRLSDDVKFCQNCGKKLG